MNNFNQTYNNKLLELRYIVHDAKKYILANWDKVDQSAYIDLSVRIKDGESGEITRYYNYRPERELIQGSWWEEHKKEQHNPVISIKDFVLDDIDGDFSVTINAKQHLWIDNQSIITIASYLEKKLNIT